MDQPRVIARRGDAPEITGANNLSGVLINAGGVEVADGDVEVDVIEEVEELGAELDTLRFAQREALDDGEVHVRLSRPAQDVAADIAEVRSGRNSGGCSVRAWD